MRLSSALTPGGQGIERRPFDAASHARPAALDGGGRSASLSDARPVRFDPVAGASRWPEQPPGEPFGGSGFMLLAHEPIGPEARSARELLHRRVLRNPRAILGRHRCFRVI